MHKHARDESASTAEDRPSKYPKQSTTEVEAAEYIPDSTVSAEEWAAFDEWLMADIGDYIAEAEADAAAKAGPLSESALDGDEGAEVEAEEGMSSSEDMQVAGTSEEEQRTGGEEQPTNDNSDSKAVDAPTATSATQATAQSQQPKEEKQQPTTNNKAADASTNAIQAPQATTQSQKPCLWVNRPQGCRFGATCKFSHAHQGQTCPHILEGEYCPKPQQCCYKHTSTGSTPAQGQAQQPNNAALVSRPRTWTKNGKEGRGARKCY
ncbi:hypothetical protein BU26DRAFT_565704 [Trematosphaeria pertusa]|uniref:C3H1-type domain-containing protein n=1 Tax=Trematosphaeria pertusa TaxID=390896 RepID=A0A6A6ID32_9PLEO|nr:uncharacterized protein BU26DRAFT_565704 [Trematosphaeria pertusa]KAF2248301.1 hypothetical protein BU26DRAFT_565704 [Trematosphaeria pertusa]